MKCEIPGSHASVSAPRPAAVAQKKPRHLILCTLNSRADHVFAWRKWFLATKFPERGRAKRWAESESSVSRFSLLVYLDNNIDGIKESLHYTNFDNQKIICQYTNRST